MRYVYFADCEKIVRINSVDTPYWKKDLEVILPEKPELILLPKSSTDDDVLVTQGGIAVNPKNKELKERLLYAGLPVVDIYELKEKTEKITGKPQKAPTGDKVVAENISRGGGVLDKIYCVQK